MSSPSRAIEGRRRSPRIDQSGPVLGQAESADPLTSAESVLSQEHLGRACFAQHLRLILPLALADLAVLCLAFLCGCQAAALLSGVPFAGESGHLQALIAMAILLYGSLGLFQNTTFQPIDEFRRIILWSALSVMLLAVAHASSAGLSLHEQWAFGLSILIMALVGPNVRSVARRTLGRFSWWQRPLLIIGNGEAAQRIHAALAQRPSFGFRVVGYVDDGHDANSPESILRNGSGTPVNRLGRIDELSAIAVAHKACWAVISSRESAAASAESSLQSTIELCAETIPNVVVVSDVAGIPALWTRIEEYGGVPGMHFESSLLLVTHQSLKRLVDLLIVAIGSPVVVPLMVLSAIAIKIASPKGPVFFGHMRVGRNGKSMVTWKFRTMVPNPSRILEEHLAADPERREEWDTFRKLAHDPRVIPRVGTILRKFSLDELPQLWNVVRGEMSLVGPRPIVHEEISRYAAAFKLYKKMRPGITGLWQVSGRNRTTFQERVDLDVYYVTNWSPWFDLYILVRTIRTVLLGEGAY